jgi:hypothetical protein
LPILSTQAVRKLCRAQVLPGRSPAQPPTKASRDPAPYPFRGFRFGEWHENWVRLFLRIRHIRNAVRLASFRQRDPRISQACVMFPLLGVVCFLRQCCAPGGRFPCGLALGSHLVSPFRLSQPHKLYNAITANCEPGSLTFSCGRKDRGSRQKACSGAGIMLRRGSEDSRPDDGLSETLTARHTAGRPFV